MNRIQGNAMRTKLLSGATARWLAVPPSAASPASSPRAVHQLARRGPSPSTSYSRSQPLRPQLPLRSSLTTPSSARRNGTMPNQQQVLQNFGTPLLHFVSTITQIAKILALSGLTLGAAVLLAFEGGHQYIEHVMMRGLPPGIVPGAGDLTKDPWGWLDEEAEESWGAARGSNGGTDSRLGLSARHALRGAYFTTEVGGGVQLPLNWGRAGGGGPTGMNVRNSGVQEDGAVGLPMESDGLALAEQFLAATVAAAEKKGIRLPDIAAMRAGVATPHAAGADVPLDPTAVALEQRLAATRERLGTPELLPLAIAGYERLYEALAATQSSVPQAATIAGAAGTAAGKDTSASSSPPSSPSPSSAPLTPSGQPHITTSRLVRLARKLGDLNVSIGNRDEAERWLKRGVEMAGGRQGGGDGSDLSLSSPAAAAKKTPSSSSSSSSSSSPSVSPSSPSSSSSSAATSPLSSSSSSPSASPSPSLTRSLVSTLLSMSSLYATTPPATPTRRSNLEEALRVQASTLRLIRLELERTAGETDATPTLSSPPASTSARAAHAGASLHALWLRHNEALVSVHLAETLYALEVSGGGGKAANNIFRKVFGSENDSAARHAKSITWLLEARKCANEVEGRLAGNGVDSKVGLVEKYARGEASVRTPAARLLRDSVRVRAEVDRMVAALGGKAAEAEAETP